MSKELLHRHPSTSWAGSQLPKVPCVTFTSQGSARGEGWSSVICFVSWRFSFTFLILLYVLLHKLLLWKRVFLHLNGEKSWQEWRSRSVNKWLLDDALGGITFLWARLDYPSLRRHCFYCIRICCLLGNMSGAGPSCKPQRIKNLWLQKASYDADEENEHGPVKHSSNIRAPKISLLWSLQTTLIWVCHLLFIGNRPPFPDKHTDT